MRYQVLVLDIHHDLQNALKYRFQGMDADFITALTYQDAIRLCAGQPFHLIILCFSEAVSCVEFLVALRRTSYAPAIVLFNPYDIKNACSALQSGADLCIGAEWPVELAADHIMAQFRRYAAYTHDKGVQVCDFQVGDIYIDPSRCVVRVKERSVKLRPREFSLLLYFMEHPNRVLTSDQICRGAWGMDYPQSVGRSVHELRKQIDANPAQSCYIKTVYRMGYRFTGHSNETCDN
ncbi:DNA-binding response regulator [Pseudoflavonifractor sp. 524-17]|uniref:winged helix-turn-helix transcriptional regulator n=1 Tax=Pseudoflavonifractor sp. 524-17 TaxID=2304577 RepID=UPI001379AB1F|nr:response regulator transcription factor [Pseudoflavonifractor sp. 524-17]NCE65099.1 DNA-binding response regulator [Pseudoflavonifractor sp. 524-17]